MKKYKKMKVLLLSSLTLMMGMQAILPAYAYGIQPTTVSETKSKEVEFITIGKNLITNPNFDTDLSGWETGNGKVFRATNNPGPSGGGHYGIDGSSTQPFIKQTVTILEDGKYYAKHSAASNATTAKFQLIKENTIIKEVTMNKDGKYHDYVLEFDAKKEEKYEIKVIVGENAYKYVNGDDFYVGTSANGKEVKIEKATFDENGNLIANCDFDEELKYYTTSGDVGIQSNNYPKYDGLSYSKNHFTLDEKNSSLKRYI